MNNKWWKILWSEFRLKVYDVLIGAARKLRTIQIDEALSNANAPGGYDYFGNLIVKMNRSSDGTLLALYQCPKKKFHLTHVSTEDFIHGVAMLPTAEKNYPLDRIVDSKFPTMGIEVLFEGTYPPASEETELTPDEKEMLEEWKSRQER